MDKVITKEDGTEELFNEEKLRTSLINSGTDPAIVEEAASNIKKHMSEIMKSEDIYRLCLDHLKKTQPDAAIKYTLKKAIMDLGPTGYVFERYFARILDAHGYQTEVNQFIRGLCVEHEVDIVAEKADKHFMVECKYHNDPGTKSDIKTALYIYARFLDVKDVHTVDKNNYSFSEAWLSTNTKCSSEAIRYANCVKMRVTAWHYPHKKNLEYYIESKKLYPVSILPSLKKKQKKKLFDNNIITIQDFLENNPNSIARGISTSQEKANRLFAEAALLLT
jgi:hypothetical protein